MPLAPELDTAGLLTRDPRLWAVTAKALYGPNITFTSSYPSQIYTVEFPSNATTEADGLLIDFLKNLAAMLNATVTPFNISTAWNASKPAGADASLSDLLEDTYPVLIGLDQVNLVRNPFYAAYGAAHDGRLPFVDPVPLTRWAFAENSGATLTEALVNKTMFMDWFSSEVLSPDEETCSSSLMVYVGSTADVNYRNKYEAKVPGAPTGFSTSRISPLSEVPDMVLPSKLGFLL
jgi:hypothetical protein